MAKDTAITVDQHPAGGPAKSDVEEASSLAPKLIYEVIRRDGEEELQRPNRSLMWSGIAAGIMISFSVVGEAVLRASLPDAPWRYLVENLGYSLGFMLVILGRMQLFTENTITTVLPVLQKRTLGCFLQMMRLWVIVLGANVVGAFLIATFYAYTVALPADVVAVMGDLSRHAMGINGWDGFVRAIPAGILVAALVWMLPQARFSSFFVILVFTWLIAAGDFAHIVAGSVEMAFLAVQGELGLGGALSFFGPVFAGNVVGGTVIFALMAWGQVMDEVEPSES
ncbi:MAG: formate/nitrite transporter family protein [Pseudomonadota bacterium]